MIRYKELYEMYGEPDFITENLQWAGHVQRMECTRIPKNVLKVKSGGVRYLESPGKDGKM
jgi:hypothetical protein